jgi:hypothetical protein
VAGLKRQLLAVVEFLPPLSLASLMIGYQLAASGVL